MEKVKYKLVVKTGDRRYSGTNANIFIILYGRNGKKSDTVQLNACFHNNFEAGQCNDCTIECENLDEIDHIELWRDDAVDKTLLSSPHCPHDSSWYVDYVQVTNQKNQMAFDFPNFRWIKPCYHYKIAKNDTSLPQDDSFKDQREEGLIEKQKTYKFKEGSYQLPPQVESLPDDETFSFWHKLDLGIQYAKLEFECKLSYFLNGNWESLDDLKKVYEMKIFGEPSGATCWTEDRFFGLQRFAGLNHSLIELCTKLPENLGVTDGMLQPLLEGCTLQQVIDSKRLFICDLKILDGIKHKEGLYICVPIALFLVNSRHDLVPVAIQLYQQKGPNNPVFLPTDPPFTWIMAKMWFNNADATYHQSLTHLGFTHLLMEGIVVVTHRQLAQSHPLFKLLAPHFLYLLAINSYAFKFLLEPNGIIDRTMSAGADGVKALVEKGIKKWRMGIHGTLPEDLIQRGVYNQNYNQNVLPGYRFRDDALLLYDAIHKYVTKYVTLYYDKPEKIAEDWELQNWRNEITKPKEQGGCGLQGVPGKYGKFTTVDQIIQTLTSIIYTCSVAHAATNFPQYDEYGFIPHYPAQMRGKPPSSKAPLTEQDVVNSLPDIKTTLDIMIIAKLLSTQGTKHLGDFEVEYIFDTKALPIVEEFRSDLAVIGVKIKQRNKQRIPAYPFLDPDVVPNSISI